MERLGRVAYASDRPSSPRNSRGLTDVSHEKFDILDDSFNREEKQVAYIIRDQRDLVRRPLEHVCRNGKREKIIVLLNQRS